MPMSATDTFDRFVASRAPALWQLAWLLTGAERTADELLETALARALPQWQRIESSAEGPAALVRGELVATYLAGHDDDAVASGPAAPAAAAESATDPLRPTGDTALELRREVLALLAALPPRHRAAVALHHSRDVAGWEAADALEVSADQLVELVAEATARAQQVTARAPTLLGCIDQVAPDARPDPTRARRAGRRAARTRRRRLLGYAAVCSALVSLVAVPVAVTDPAPTDAPAASDEPTVPVAARLVDPLRIPDSCASLPDVPDPPGYPYELFGADAVWMRFCPAEDAVGALDALAFAPDDTVVDREVDELADGWATPGPGPAACHPTGGIRDGLVRLQVGTLDGSLHVVDMRVGCAGSVALDGRAGAVDSRTAFTEAIGLLGAELLAEVPEPGLVPPEAIFCPAAPARVLDLDRTTVADYPKVRGLSMPLPATSALVCTYPVAAARSSADVRPRGTLLDAAAAETLRAAYLSRSSEPPGRRCRDRGGPWYGVVLSDATGSRRTFIADLGPCGVVRGPRGGEGPVGPWLAELLSTRPLGRVPA
ncbi:hypothetical protein BH20ACT6_BH20ACT6_03460 [soil metagenome]